MSGDVGMIGSQYLVSPPRGCSRAQHVGVLHGKADEGGGTWVGVVVAVNSRADSRRQP